MLLQGWWRATRVALASGALVLLWGCGGGSVGGDAGEASPPAQHQGPGGADSPDASLVLDPPRGQPWDGAIVLSWNGDALFTRFSVWLAPSDTQDFHEVAGAMAVNAAVVPRGASWKLDFPTARIRVRGCDAAGTTCANSNEQLLAEALMEGVATVWTRSNDSSSGGHSGYQLSRNGLRLVAARFTDMGMLGNPFENFDPAQIDVFNRYNGGWVREATIYTPDPRGVTGAVAISGDGSTLAINLNYSWSPWTVEPNEPGVVVIYVRDDRASWTIQAAIRAPDTFGRVVKDLGAQLALSGDGRRLAAGSEAGIMVFGREADGRWRHDSTIDSQSSRLAMSADGKVIAAAYAAGSVPDAGYYRPYHAVRIFARDCHCTGWRQQAHLHSHAYPYAQGNVAMDEFGLGGLALDDGGTTLAVGAARSGSGTPGAVYVFGQSGGVWQERAFLQNQTETGNDRFGRYVSLSGDGRMLAGSACGNFAPVPGVNRNYAEGTRPLSQCRLVYLGPDLTHGAYLYRADDAGAWRHVASVVPPLPLLRGDQTRMPEEDLMVPMITGDAEVLVMGNTLSLGSYGMRPDSGIFSY